MFPAFTPHLSSMAYWGTGCDINRQALSALRVALRRAGSVVAVTTASMSRCGLSRAVFGFGYVFKCYVHSQTRRLTGLIIKTCYTPVEGYILLMPLSSREERQAG